MKYKKFKLTLLAICVSGTALLYCHGNEACSQGSQKVAAQTSGNSVENHKEVVIYQPIISNRTDPYSFNAELQPLDQASIFARANGYIEEQYVDIGTHVQEGDILARLSLPELEDQMAQAKEEIVRQKADLKFAESQYNRVKGFRDSGAVSISEIEKNEAERDMARASLSALQARLAQLEKEYGYTEIKAPFDGIVTKRNVNRGDRISVNDSIPMYELAQADELRVVVRLPQTVISKVDLQSEALLSVNNDMAQMIPVQFARQSGAIDNSSGTLRVEYSLNNRQTKLLSGLTGKIHITPAKQDNVIHIPTNAVKVMDGKNYVMTVNPSNQVQTKPITAGANVGGSIVVHDGVTEEDRIILNPNALLQEGDKVTVQQQNSKS